MKEEDEADDADIGAELASPTKKRRRLDEIKAEEVETGEE